MRETDAEMALRLAWFGSDAKCAEVDAQVHIEGWTELRALQVEDSDRLGGRPAPSRAGLFEADRLERPGDGSLQLLAAFGRHGNGVPNVGAQPRAAGQSVPSSPRRVPPPLVRCRGGVGSKNDGPPDET